MILDNDRLPTPGKRVEINPALVSLTRLGRFKDYEFSEVAEGPHKEQFSKYLERVRDWASQGFGLYVWGKTGVGKTHAAASLLKELTKRGYSGIFITTGELIDVFFGNGDKEENERILNRIRSCHILVLDGMGDEYIPNNHAYLRSRLLNLLKERSCRRYTSTIVTTGISPITTDDGILPIRLKYGADIANLFSDLLYPVQMIGRNHRALRQKQMKELLK